MFERFTERARHAIVLAQEEASVLGHSYVGTEHVLLGLLREDEGLAARVLESFELTVERVRGQVVRIVGGSEAGGEGGERPFTPPVKRVLESATREARSLGYDHVGTEHLLLALVREPDGVATRILLDLDADAERVRHRTIHMLAGASGPRPRPPAHLGGRPRPPLNWRAATMLWRPEGLELRVPLRLGEAAIATFAADEAWTAPPLSGLRREIWNGWLALASPGLLDEVDPRELRSALDAAARRADDVSGREAGRVEDFLRALRDGPP